MFKKRLSAWRKLVPSDCPGCQTRTRGHDLCPQCNLSLLNIDKRPRCKSCAGVLHYDFCLYCTSRQIYFDKTVYGFDYRDLGQQLVHDYKIHKRLALAGVLADIMARQVLQQYTVIPRAVVVPVPGHQQSLAMRGFSPPAELAKLLARKFGLQYSLDLLHRKRETAKQTTLGFWQRQLAQIDAYSVQSQNLSANACVIVVDDVMTTGATVNAVAKTLKSAGARQVHAWVLARALA